MWSYHTTHARPPSSARGIHLRSEIREMVRRRYKKEGREKGKESASAYTRQRLALSSEHHKEDEEGCTNRR